MSGSIRVAGTATDNIGITSVTVSVDGGMPTSAMVTTSWNVPIDTTTIANGSHAIEVAARDKIGNVGTATVAIDVNNAAPVTDTTAPIIRIVQPSAGATVGGAVMVSGSSSDVGGIAKVEARLDGDAWRLASGTSSWSISLATTNLANGIHTIAARATDQAGNIGTDSIHVTVSNEASPSTHLVTPKGVTIDVDSAGHWTADEIDALLTQSAYQLELVGPTVTIKVQDTYGSQTTTTTTSSGGRFTSFHATIYLKGVNSTFAAQPEAQIAHEYGHAWTLYHLYLDHNGDWSSYLERRWSNEGGSISLIEDPRLDSSYVWDRREIIADDYRLLFGSPLAISERSSHLNSAIPEPADVLGLRTFLVDTWGAPA